MGCGQKINDCALGGLGIRGFCNRGRSDYLLRKFAALKNRPGISPAAVNITSRNNDAIFWSPLVSKLEK